jgi:hypothetical protein
VWVSVAAWTFIFLTPAAWAQQAASGIAGVVRDASGAVLPGVTVEAASPALIEKVRTVVTDGEGRYNIVGLPPGTYTVTFTLPGFNTLKREGIVLTAGFTAPITVEMPVGALEETLTVTGEAPLVDTQNIRQQSQISSELLSVLPSSKAAVNAVISLTPGVTGQADVGGSSGVWTSQGTTGQVEFHGKTGLNMSYDGMGIVAALGNGNTGYLVNPLMVQEIVVEKGAGSAESTTSQLTMNAVPKEGSNNFNFVAQANYTNHNFESNNLNDELRALGVTSVDSVRYLYTTGISAGGPFKRDKLWFHSAAQLLENYNYEANNYFNGTHGTPFYTPDFSRPADQLDESYRVAIRTTWQASPRNKANFGYELQKINEHRRRSNSAPEAAINYRHKTGIIQGAWNSPVNNKLLFEAGASVMFFNFPTYPQPEVPDPLNMVSILEQSTNYRYVAQTSFTKPQHNERRAERFSVSYVTGSHAFKVGMYLEQHLRDAFDGGNGPQPHINYRFNRGQPTTIVQNATPYLTQNRTRADLGVFAQDQWAISRFTVNYGVRFDYFNGYVPEQTIAATQFVPARHYDEVKNAPLWTDISPRVGVSYDLFGNGRTALKAAVGRYLVKETFALNQRLNPLSTSVNSVTRTWIDSNGDYRPDCDLKIFTANGECGPISNTSFGQATITTQYAKDVLEGFGVRPHNWDVSAEVQHQLTRGLSITAGYYRSAFSHPNERSARIAGADVYVTDNLLVTPADFDHFCITAPIDPRLPGGGGYQVCSLYDIKPAKFGQVQNLVAHPSKYGKVVQQSNFFSVSTSTRFQSGLLLSGGVDTGRIVEDKCFVVDSPQALLHCRLETPWSSKTQVKVQGSYPLPQGIIVSAVFQDVPGPQYEATYTATNAEVAPSLGRNLAACGARLVGCTATVSVPLLPPMKYFEARRTQLDLRIGKTVRFGGKTRLQANLDVYNALNANSLINVNSTFGPRWRQAAAGGTGGSTIGALGARLIQFSGEFTF